MMSVFRQLLLEVFWREARSTKNETDTGKQEDEAVNVEVFDEETENDEMAAAAMDVVHKSETVDETELERVATRHVARFEEQESWDNETEVFTEVHADVNDEDLGDGVTQKTVDDSLVMVRKERSLAEVLSSLDATMATGNRGALPPKSASRAATPSTPLRSMTSVSPPFMLASAATVANARLHDYEGEKLNIMREDESSDSRADLTAIHATVILVFVVVAAIVMAIRRGRDKNFVRVTTWLFPAGGPAVLLHTQRDVRDLLRSLQPSNMVRNLVTVSSRMRAVLRNIVRRQSVFSATLGKWRIFPVQYCPPRWADALEGGISGDADQSASLGHTNSVLDISSSNRKIVRGGFGTAETMERENVTEWTKDWDISPRPQTEDTKQQGMFKDISDGGSSLRPGNTSDEPAKSVARADESDAGHRQGEEELMNYFITGSWNKKRRGTRAESRSGGGTGNHRLHSRTAEQENSQEGDVEQGVRPDVQAEGVTEIDCSSRDNLFPGNHSLHFQPILTNATDVQWVIDLTPKARHNERWTLLYSTACDGVSLNTLFHANQMSGGSGPALMLIRDDGGGIFGAYTSDRWRREKIGRCYGNGEAFVFSVTPQRVRHSWTQANYLFQSGSTTSLSLGGGSHFAIWLDGDLQNGTSGTCETFGSPCLSSTPEFQISSLEVWGFTALNRASLS